MTIQLEISCTCIILKVAHRLTTLTVALITRLGTLNFITSEYICMIISETQGRYGFEKTDQSTQ